VALPNTQALGERETDAVGLEVASAGEFSRPLCDQRKRIADGGNASVSNGKTELFKMLASRFEVKAKFHLGEMKNLGTLIQPPSLNCIHTCFAIRCKLRRWNQVSERNRTRSRLT
jgi:hypothetical protein